MGLNSCRNFRLHGREVIKFVNHCNIQIGNTWFAVAAVCTFSTIRMERCICDHRCVVFFFFGCSFICSCLVYLLFCVIAAHDGTDCRSGQSIMNTLYRCQTYSKRGVLFVKQSASRKTFHDSDSYVILLADFVQTCTVRIDSFEACVKFLCKHRINIFARRKHVKRRIDAEKDHLYITGFCCFDCNLRVVGAHADMTDDALFL